MGALSPVHLVIVAIAAIVLLGPKKLPELMRSLGKGMGELQKGIDESKRMMTQAMNEAQDEPKPEYPQYTPAVVEAPAVAPVATTATEPVAATAVLEPETKPAPTRRKAKTTSPKAKKADETV